MKALRTSLPLAVIIVLMLLAAMPAAGVVAQGRTVAGTGSSLTPGADQGPPKCGTTVVLDIKENWSTMSAALRAESDWAFQRPTDSNGGIDNLQHLLPKLTATANFVIHWTDGTDGGSPADAPPPEDSDADGIPNYIEDMGSVFENVRTFEVGTRGFQAPPGDGSQPNDGRSRNPNAKYDVFVYDMGYYGYANPEQYPSSPSCSYVSLDNDYSGFPGTPLACVQVTAAHEFCHAVQFAYDCTEDRWWMETTSTYMEDEVYPDINDNYQYLPYWFESCGALGLKTYDGGHEYGNFIWGKRLSEDFGDGAIKAIWQGCQTSNATAATNSYLASKGSSFEAEYRAFARANLFLEDMYADGADYRAALGGGRTSFGGVYLEYQYDAATDGLPFTIDQSWVNRSAWMDTWDADYVTLNLDPGVLGYRVFFDGLDENTKYQVSLVTKRGTQIAESRFSLDAQKDGWVDLRYDTYDSVALAIVNAGDTPTSSPSWRVTVTHSVAVTYPYYDHMQDVLDAMGQEYVTIDPAILADYDPEAMAAPELKVYDAVFVNCASGLETIAASSPQSLRDYVGERGGTVYASDFAFAFVASSFPGYAIFMDYCGLGGVTTTADVVDPGLQDYLGASTVELLFDLGGWVPIESVSGSVTVYLEGPVTYYDADYNEVTDVRPITIGFDYGDGSVVYTSFHEAAQSATAASLMEYLGIKAVTEQLARENKEALEAEGYRVAKDNRGMIDQGETISYTYQAKGGEALKLMLNWAGSTMRLSVYDAEGTLVGEAESDSSPVYVEIAKAQSTYTYEVTAVDIPTANYGYALTIGADFPWDINGDSTVNYKDLAILGAAYGSCTGDPAYNPAADVKWDGCVDYKDLAILGAHYGETY